MYALLSYVLDYSILITGNINHKVEYLSFINIIKDEISLHFYHKYLDKNIEFKKNKK